MQQQTDISHVTDQSENHIRVYYTACRHKIEQ